MASRGPAARLPFDVLYLIFEQLLVLNLAERGEHLHGGRLVGWDSNEAIRSLPLVCGDWQEAATAMLYRSISIQGARKASRFLAAIEDKPELAELVHRVSVGLEVENDAGRRSLAAEAAASQDIATILHSLPQLEHLLLRPLDPSARPRLLDFFARQRGQLKSLVLLARDVSDGPRWNGLLRSQDCALLAEGLERLNIDVWDSSAIEIGASLPSPPRLALTHLCLDSDCPKGLTYSYICPTLTHLHLYFEHLRPAREAADALSRARHLRHLYYVSNPTLEELEQDFDSRRTPTLDLLLPSLPLLETLHVSAADISPSFLAILPPRLHRVVIHSLSRYGFAQPTLLLDMLRSSALSTKGLRELEIRDSTERWRGLVKGMKDACRRRGIKFKLVAGPERE